MEGWGLTGRHSPGGVTRDLVAKVREEEEEGGGTEVWSVDLNDSALLHALERSPPHAPPSPSPPLLQGEALLDAVYPSPAMSRVAEEEEGAEAGRQAGEDNPENTLLKAIADQVCLWGGRRVVAVGTKGCSLFVLLDLLPSSCRAAVLHPLIQPAPFPHPNCRPLPFPPSSSPPPSLLSQSSCTPCFPTWPKFTHCHLPIFHRQAGKGGGRGRAGSTTPTRPSVSRQCQLCRCPHVPPSLLCSPPGPPAARVNLLRPRRPRRAVSPPARPLQHAGGHHEQEGGAGRGPRTRGVKRSALLGDIMSRRGWAGGACTLEMGEEAKHCCWECVF